MVNWLGLRDGNGDLLLENNLVGEESDPVLEVGHNAVGRSPGAIAIGLVRVQLLRGAGWLRALSYLVCGLVVKSNEE